MKFKRSQWLLGLLVILTLIPSCVSAYISENPRQGFVRVFSKPLPASKPLLSAFTAGFLVWDTITSAKLRFWGNFRWPDKPAHLKPPCDEKDLGEWLDRFDFGRAFGDGPDGWHWGRHFGRKLTPVLFAGRRYQPLTQQYFNRNRYYAPKYGRFTSRDPIGFWGDSNLYRYVRNRPQDFVDPFGLKWISKWLEAFHHTIRRYETIPTSASPPSKVPGFEFFKTHYFIMRADYYYYQRVWVPDPSCVSETTPAVTSERKLSPIPRFEIKNNTLDAYSGYLTAPSIPIYSTEYNDSARAHEDESFLFPGLTQNDPPDF